LFTGYITFSLNHLGHFGFLSIQQEHSAYSVLSAASYIASPYSGYDYEDEPVMWDLPEDNFADLNESPDYEALSDLHPPRRSSVGWVSEEFSFPPPWRRSAIFAIPNDDASTWL
jgi:hypothetical protein